MTDSSATDQPANSANATAGERCVRCGGQLDANATCRLVWSGNPPEPDHDAWECAKCTAGERPSDRAKLIEMAQTKIYDKGLEIINSGLNAEVERLSIALEACLQFIETALSGANNGTGPFVPGVTDLELKPDGTFMLSQVRELVK